MNLSAAITSGVVLAVFTAIQAWINNGRFNRLEAENATLRSDLTSQIATLRSELSTEIASLRSDLLHVALDRRRDD